MTTTTLKNTVTITDLLTEQATQAPTHSCEEHEPELCDVRYYVLNSIHNGTHVRVPFLGVKDARKTEEWEEAFNLASQHLSAGFDPSEGDELFIAFMKDCFEDFALRSFMLNDISKVLDETFARTVVNFIALADAMFTSQGLDFMEEDSQLIVQTAHHGVFAFHESDGHMLAGHLFNLLCGVYDELTKVKKPQSKGAKKKANAKARKKQKTRR